MTYEEYVRRTLSEHESEPFCPFDFFGYCDAAYSDACYSCEESMKDYVECKVDGA